MPNTSLAGPAPDSGYDVLDVSGSVTLAGKLTVNFIDGFAPTNGQSFIMLRYGTNLVGNFDQVIVTGLAPGFQHQVAPTGKGGLELVAQSEATPITAPRLSVARDSANLVLTWPSASTGFVLESNDNLANPAGWKPVVITPSITGQEVRVTVPTAGLIQFFRLRHP
ncbi:MAG: hypothetical protein ABI651_12275 [Verrucomicrobiota bacterium]